MRPARHFLFAGVMALAALGCDSKSSHGSPTPPLAASNVAAALGIDADLPAPPDPSPAPGDLASEVAAFTTLDGCVADHATKIDPLIGDALLSFGYDTFVRDACRQIDAAKSKDPTKCDAIVASELMRHCEATVAMVAGKPNDCPLIDSNAEHGRLPRCVAAASRDPRLCMAEAGDARAECTALVMRDPVKCDVVAKSEIARCRRDGERLASSLPPANNDLPALPKLAAKLELTALPGTQPLVPSSAALSSDVEAGVVITIRAAETTFSFGPTRAESAFPHEVTPASPLRIGLEMHVAKSEKQEATVRDVGLEVPGGVLMSNAQLHGPPKIKIVQLSRERGGPVELTVDGEIGSSPQAFAFHLEVKTYVRDVFDPIASLRPAPTSLPR